MKRTAMPYMPWFHSSFLESTQGWTLEERGAYVMLLGAQWGNGPLPSDTARLAAIVGVSSPALKLLWKTVSRKFRATSEGLVNDRLEQHRQRALDLLDGRRRGAARTNAQLHRGKVVSIKREGADGR